MSKPVPAVPVAAAVPVAPGVPLSGPPGAPPGGVYTIEKHCGLITILIALFVWLLRFAELAMRVTYADPDAEGGSATRVLLIESLDEDAGMATWKLADVEENRPQAKKGQGMNKKQREWRLIAPFADVVAANLFVGF